MSRFTQTKMTFIRKPLAIAIGIAAAQLSALTAAQGLEEIIVTSQKRAENLQEVPLSVATISGEKLESAGIENLGDLTLHMPNIHFTETGLSTQVRVRGIGSDNSQGFEQSVGMYLDGVYYGRAQLFRSPMMDMERAELLRGPQSTLFGKNSIAGALNLTSALPTHDFEARASVSQELEFNTTELNGMLSGGLSDNVQARLAIRHLTDDGYMYNSYLDADQPERTEDSARLSVTWQASDNLDIYVKAEQHTFETTGRAIEITQDEVLASSPYGLTYNEVLQGVLSRPGFESETDLIRQADTAEHSDNTINNFTFKADYALGEHTVTWITGLLDFSYNELCDCDFVPADIVPVELNEDYEQTSHEIRIASPMGETVEWLAGAFIQNYDQVFDDQINLAEGNVLADTYPVLTNTGIRRDFEQSSTAWALFGRATWSISDAWHLTLGARYTEETKDATKEVNAVSLITDEVLSDPAIGSTYMGVFLVENNTAFVGADGTTPLMHAGYDVKGSRDESAFTPLINVEYDISGDMMMYGSFTTGFKAGGFDPRSNRVGLFDFRAANPAAPAPPAEEENPLQYFEFDNETANAMELGMKNTLADGRLELNFALYHTTYEDLQISQFDGGVGFNVGNAKETVVQGLEVDGRWLVVDNLTAFYGFSFLDFEYKDFENGNCFAGQTPNTDSDGDTIADACDYTGKRGVYTPEMTFNFSLDYVHSLGNNIDFISVLDWQHVGAHQVHVNLDPSGEIDGYNMMGLRLGLESNNWSVGILGKNLLDEKVVTYTGNAPLSDSQFGTNTHYSFVRRPMTIALEATYKY
ncbi:TonB-dependent receptor [Teredinibacter purpureus]|uniref:TonB-dependent receptor n=1 Tax=Teredinibacter purpureus TaxID=2731756 RepID=UPI0005F81413|nr:TonB-dependent receptor [Teredinibacter purpureus]